jgi:hypothetical protein
MKKIIDYICRHNESMAHYFEIERPINKIANALKLTGYNKEQAMEMAISLVWNMPSTAINAIKYAENNLSEFCDECGK